MSNNSRDSVRRIVLWGQFEIPVSHRDLWTRCQDQRQSPCSGNPDILMHHCELGWKPKKQSPQALRGMKKIRIYISNLAPHEVCPHTLSKPGLGDTLKRRGQIILGMRCASA